MKYDLKKLKIVLFCFLTLSITFNVEAQEEQTQKSIEYGAMAGVVYHNFTNQPPHTGGKLGFMAGLFGAYPLNNKIALQLELAYFQQGGTYIQFKDDTRFGVPESFVSKNVKDASVTLHNVYIPLQAKLSLFTQPFLPKIIIGPYCDINIAATESHQKTGEIEDNIYGTTTGNDIVTDQYKKFQFGAVAGLEFQIPRGEKGSILFGVRYKYGLTPVKESYSYIDYFAITEDFKSNALSISIGINL